jgi:hypothetical protein
MMPDMGPYDQGYVMTTAPALWQIVVQRIPRETPHTAELPFCVGDLAVNGNNIRLWN